MTSTRLLRPLLVLLTVAAGLGLAPHPASAAFHFMKISEVFPGTTSHPNAQYVELQMYANGQSQVSGHAVKAYDAAGALVGTFTFGSAVAVGTSQSTILVATPEAATLFGVTANLAMTPVLSAAGGKVCWDALDCVSWGSYSGSTTGVGNPYRPTEGLPLGSAATRDLSGGASPTLLEAADDTGDSAADFDPKAPTPRTNAGVTGAASGGMIDLPPTGVTVHENQATLTVGLFRTGSTASSVSVGFSTTSAGTATPGVDFVATSGTATFAAGQASTTFPVSMIDDTLVEGVETIGLSIRGPTGGAVLDRLDATRELVDNDPSFSIADVSANEANSNTVATFTVTRTPATATFAQVRVSTSVLTASTADFVQRDVVMSFNAGQASKPFSVTVKGDLLDEVDETFRVDLSESSGATIFDGQAVGTIVDDDPPPTISVGDVVTDEPDAGELATVTLPVTLSAASGKNISVNYATVSGTAGTKDFVAKSSTLSFLPGQTSKAISVRVRGDLLDEVDEVFTVVLSSPSSVTIADGEGAVTITDNDPPPTLSIGDLTVAEPGVDTFVKVPVTLSAPSGKTVTVLYSTANGTAVAPGDYTARTGVLLTFTPGSTTRQASVKVRADGVAEPPESFTVVLSTPTEASVADGSGTVTISPG